MHRTKDGALSGILSSQGHPRLVGRLRLSKDLKSWGLIRLSERLKSLLCIRAKTSEIETGYGCSYNAPRRLAKAPVALAILGLSTATSSLSCKVSFLKLLMLVCTRFILSSFDAWWSIGMAVTLMLPLLFLLDRTSSLTYQKPTHTDVLSRKISVNLGQIYLGVLIGETQTLDLVDFRFNYISKHVKSLNW